MAAAAGFRDLPVVSYITGPEIVKLLLENGAKIDAITADGWIPLHSACRWNSAECVEILLAEGSDVNCKTTGNQTPLHLAAFCGNSRETIQLLFLQPYLDTKVKNCQDDRAYDIAVRNNNCVELFSLCDDALINTEET